MHLSLLWARQDRQAAERNAWEFRTGLRQYTPMPEMFRLGRGQKKGWAKKVKIGINFLFYGEKSYFIFLNISYKYSLVSINAVLNVGFVVCIFFFFKGLGFARSSQWLGTISPQRLMSSIHNNFTESYLHWQMYLHCTVLLSIVQLKSQL